MIRNQSTVSTIITAAIVMAGSVYVGAQQSHTSSGSGTIPQEQSTNSSRSVVTSSTPAFNQPHMRPSARQRTPLTEAELLSGVDLTDEQKSAIDRVHREMRGKMEVVSRDRNESPEQKAAMLEGMNRMQLRQVFDLLKPEQQEQVRRKIFTTRSANRQQEKASSQPKSR